MARRRQEPYAGAATSDPLAAAHAQLRAERRCVQNLNEILYIVCCGGHRTVPLLGLLLKQGHVAGYMMPVYAKGSLSSCWHDNYRFMCALPPPRCSVCPAPRWPCEARAIACPCIAVLSPMK